MEGLSARLQRSTNKHTSLFECSRCDVTGKELWVRGLDHASAGAVDRDYHAYRVMGDWVSHLAFAVCLKDAPLLPRQ